VLIMKLSLYDYIDMLSAPFIVMLLIAIFVWS